MGKPIRRYSSYSLRRNRRTRLRKGIIHVQAIFINPILTIPAGRVRVVVWASDSSGASGEGRPGFDDRSSEKGLRDFQTESEGSHTEMDNACAGNADCGKDSHQELLDGQKHFWLIIAKEVRSLLSLLFSRFRTSILGWWKSLLWPVVHGTFFYLIYHTRYILPLLLVDDFFKAIGEALKDFPFTLDSVSFRKRILKFLASYSLLQLKSRTRLESMYSNTTEPPISIRLRFVKYWRFMVTFLKEYKPYSGLFSRNKFTSLLVRIVVCSYYFFFLSKRIALLPQSIKILIIILSTLHWYLTAHSQF